VIVRELVTQWGISVDMAKLIQFDRALEDAKVKANNLGASIKAVGAGISSLGTKLTLGITAPLVALGGVSFKNAAELQGLHLSLQTTMGSAAAAGAEFERLTQLAKLPGIGFREAIQGSTNLQIVGFSADKARGIIEQFGNAVARTGGGKLELGRTITQLVQMSSAGKVLTQDLKPILQMAPAVSGAMKKAFGTINAADIEKTGISATAFIDKMVVALSELERAPAGLQNSIENISDSAFRASAAFGNILTPTLAPAMSKFADALERVAKWMDTLTPFQRDFITWALIAAAALGPMLFILGKIVSMVGGFLFMASVLTMMETSLGALAASAAALALPFIATAAVVASFIALLVTIVKNWSDIKDAAGIMWRAVAGYFSELGREAGLVWQGILDWAGEVTDSIALWFSQAVDSAIASLKEIPSEIVTYVKSAFAPGGSAGGGEFGGSAGGGLLPPSISGGSITTNQTEISAPITVNVPEGTTVDQADNIARIASRAVSDKLDTMLRNAHGALSR